MEEIDDEPWLSSSPRRFGISFRTECVVMFSRTTPSNSQLTDVSPSPPAEVHSNRSHQRGIPGLGAFGRADLRARTWNTVPPCIRVPAGYLRTVLDREKPAC